MSDNNNSISITLFVPLLLGLATLIMQGVTTRAEFNNRLAVLDAQEQQQTPVVEQAQKLRAQLESIAGATAKLAEAGNQNAVVIRDQLKAQGISISAPK